MAERKKATGRPKTTEEKRDKIVNVRFTATEFKSLEDLEKETGLNKTELVRKRVLKNADKIVINSRELLDDLDFIGSEMGRIGNNINQLARHANVLKLQNSLNPAIVSDFEKLMAGYLDMQQKLEVSLRKIIRLMGS